MLQSLKYAEVAVSYKVTSDTIRKHFKNPKTDENLYFIEKRKRHRKG